MTYYSIPNSFYTASAASTTGIYTFSASDTTDASTIGTTDWGREWSAKIFGTLVPDIVNGWQIEWTGQPSWTKQRAALTKRAGQPEAPRRARPPLAFNRYINASDLLEEFIRFLGENQVRKREILQIPIDLFIKWLIIRACEEDQEEPNVTLELPQPRQQPRCLGCGRFRPKASTVQFCGLVCATLFYQRQERLQWDDTGGKFPTPMASQSKNMVDASHRTRKRNHIPAPS